MCPYPFYTTMREYTDPRKLRLQLVPYANQHGVKPAVCAFHCSVKTVRKWRNRYDGTLASLTDNSRKPQSPL